MTHRITLERNTLRFAAAHFTTAGSECEPLHGHNYDVVIHIEGELTGDGWILDFGVVKQLARGVAQELDHRFILQAAGGRISWHHSGSEIEVRHGERRYVIPSSDVAVLDIDNSTAERLAEWFARRLWRELEQRGATNISRVSVGIEEMPGQTGWFTLDVRG